MKIQPLMGSAYSGSMKGITASHNKGGAYFRGRTIPTNPNTTRQQAVRGVLGALSSAWTSTLTDSQRQAWRDYAANTPTTDSLGNTITLSGQNMYVRANTARQLATAQGLGVAFSLINDAPVIFNTGVGASSITNFELDATTPPGDIALDVNYSEPQPAAGDCFLFIAAPQTAGTQFYKGPYQLASLFAVTATDTQTQFTGITLDMATQWASATIPVIGWDGLFVPLRTMVVYDDGRVSQDFKSLVLFTDATP